MNRIRSLNFALVLFVFIMMILSSILSGIILFILDEYNVIAQIRSTPILYLIVGLIVSIIIGTFLSFLIGYFFLKPLNELIEVTREVSKGNFNVKAKEINQKFEVGELIRSFNIMTGELSSIEMFRKDFINNFSHEFRTPVMSIKGFAKLLQNKNLSQEKREEYTNIIVDETKRLSHLCSNILKISKLEHQEIVERKTTFALDEQIRKCILLLENIWSEKEIEFNIDLDEVFYIGDEELLQQVWVNLISNAIKFSLKGGKIDIKLTTSNNHIQCIIKDYGIGMTDETLDRIFEQFYQGDQSHSYDGNGLGLSLVKRILELYHGKIHVESKVDEGSTFVVKLVRGS